MEGASAVTALGSVIASTIKIAEKTFEICAVDNQAKAVLQIVNQVNGQLENAKVLRRQKSLVFTTFEKRMIDDTFRQTEEAIFQVANHTERARADMEVSAGKVKVNTRLLYVLRDSPNIHVSLAKLGIANQSLTMVLFMLTNREARSNLSGRSDMGSYAKPPPTYEEATFFAEKRLKNIRRRAEVQNADSKSLGARSRSASSLATLGTLPVSESANELEGVEPERPQTKFSSMSVPTIHFPAAEKKKKGEEEELDFLLFQAATCFTPPATEQPWSVPFDPIQQAVVEAQPDNVPVPDFRPELEARPKSWSGVRPLDTRWPPQSTVPIGVIELQSDRAVVVQPREASQRGSSGLSHVIEAEMDNFGIWDSRPLEPSPPVHGDRLSPSEQVRSPSRPSPAPHSASFPTIPARPASHPISLPYPTSIGSILRARPDAIVVPTGTPWMSGSNVAAQHTSTQEHKSTADWSGQLDWQRLPIVPSPVASATANALEGSTTPNFSLGPESRPRGWSSSARVQANELFLTSQSPSEAEPPLPTRGTSPKGNSTYPPPKVPAIPKERPPYPQSTASIRHPSLPQERQIRGGEQGREQSNEVFIDWYSPYSFSNGFASAASPPAVSEPTLSYSKGRAEKWYRARVDS